MVVSGVVASTLLIGVKVLFLLLGLLMMLIDHRLEATRDH
jgi:hypothetical protein